MGRTHQIDPRQYYAVHEAGHATALKHGRLTVTRMAVGDWGGYTDFHGERTDDQRSMQTCAVGVLAGQEAQVDWLTQHYGYSRGQALRETAQGASDDLRQFEGYSAASGLDEVEARRRARALVQRNRDAIERLADRLRERGELSRWSR